MVIAVLATITSITNRPLRRLCVPSTLFWLKIQRKKVKKKLKIYKKKKRQKYIVRLSGHSLCWPKLKNAAV